MDKTVGTIVFLAVPLLSFVLFKLIPIISPRGYRTEQFASVLNTLMLGLVAFGCVIAVVALQAAIGADINISKVVFVCVGLLFIFIGNFMGKFRKNFFIGIRTPWTLSSDEVWGKTHRVGGWCMVAAGLLMGAGAFIATDLEWLIFGVISLVLIPVVYSYFAYRSLEGFETDSENKDESDA